MMNCLKSSIPSRVWVFANLPIEQARRFRRAIPGTITPKAATPSAPPPTYRRSRTKPPAPFASGLKLPTPGPVETTGMSVALGWSGPPVITVPMSAITTIEKTRGLFLETRAAIRLRRSMQAAKAGWVETGGGEGRRPYRHRRCVRSEKCAAEGTHRIGRMRRACIIC